MCPPIMSTPEALPQSDIPDDDALPPRTGWQQMLWLLIWLVGAVSAIGLLMMVYVLAQEILGI